MHIRQIERRVIVGSRFLTLIAVAGSLVGSVLMFCLGITDIFVAFRYGLQPSEDGEHVYGAAAIIGIIDSLDRFLIAIVLLYFAYGVYMLFIHPEKREEALALPAWLHVQQIGQLKQVVAELIIVILFVLFLRQALQSFGGAEAPLAWNAIASLLVLPVSALLLGLALKLVELHPKGKDTSTREDTRPDSQRRRREEGGPEDD